MSDWHWQRVTEEQAETLSELYFLLDGDRQRIGEAIGLGRILDVNYLTHILVRRRIVAKARQMRRDRVYTREEHVAKLQEIRDACLADENYKTALTAEIAVGRAAGLYENIGAGQEDEEMKAQPRVEDMDTDAIKRRLAKMQRLPAPAPEVNSAVKPSNEEAF